MRLKMELVLFSKLLGLEPQKISLMDKIYRYIPLILPLTAVRIGVSLAESMPRFGAGHSAGQREFPD